MLGKVHCFQCCNAIISRHADGEALFFCVEVNQSLSTMVDGNNSGAFLFTRMR
jgi:hypothetical protein